MKLHDILNMRWLINFTVQCVSSGGFFGVCCCVHHLLQEDPGRLTIVYNHFKSAVAYDTLSLNFLTGRQAAKSTKQELAGFEFEPELSDVWKDVHDFYCACTVYGCMLDNIASEQVKIIKNYFMITIFSQKNKIKEVNE